MTVSKVNLYISAAPELKEERDALGRLVPSIPTALGWQIVQTPQSNQPFDPEAVRRADVHLLVLGADIKAPVGWEWQLARRAGHRPAMFRQERLRTPAGDAFVRELAPVANWRTYRDTPDLVRQASALLGEHLLTHAVPYELSLSELEQLRAWLKREPAAQQASAPRPVTAAGGVILTPERYVPSEGTLVE
jgi:hypothetical protein